MISEEEILDTNNTYINEENEYKIIKVYDDILKCYIYKKELIK